VRVLVSGAGGQVGREVVALLESRHGGPDAARDRQPIEVIAADRARLDVGDRDAVMAAVVTLEPDLVLNLAAFTAVDACESEPDKAFRTNALGTRHVAEASRLVGAHLLTVSTDYVFDGTLDRPYNEWDEPRPMSVYGLSKLAGEREAGDGATVVRTSWVCGRHGGNIVKTILRLAGGEGPIRFVDDQHGCPTEARDLAGMIVELALARRPGIFHVTNQGPTTWYELARCVVEWAGGDTARVEPIKTADLSPPRPATRPANSVLDNAALRLSGTELLPDWRLSFESLVADLVAPGPDPGK
jgi:dTDP-4-dehydrorhamnose reductase